MMFDAGHGTAPDLIYAKGSQTLPPPIRPFSTENNAPSSLSRSASAGTSAATLSSTKIPRNTPPHRGPQKVLGTGGVHCLSHRSRGYHIYQDPRTPHHRLLHRPTDRGEITRQQGRLKPSHGPRRHDPRLLHVQVAAILAYGPSPVLPLWHH